MNDIILKVVIFHFTCFFIFITYISIVNYLNKKKD